MVPPPATRRSIARAVHSRRWVSAAASFFLGATPATTAFAQAEAPAPFEITADTKLDPTRSYGPLVIKASNITVDGQGAAIIGRAGGDPKTFTGDGVYAQGVSGVTLKNLEVHGWENGLHLRDAAGWTIEDCDFSDNFHDPAFGWGEQGRRGGIVLERVTKSTLRRNKANRVWDACVLVDSNDNVLEHNDLSRTSNTCLKLWTASRNKIVKNDLSYGLRKDPGEVHARDSTCVLLESGSNDNHLIGNDCTHGGDGIFVRVLNGWVSTGNVFENNDCSYANNNCVEAWSPRNVWRKNKANHGSYGFWLGASDQTVVEGNEASFNGLDTGFHNSPHLPNDGHAGIVFMFGPSSHTVVRGNTCIGNNGAGIAAIGDLDSKGASWRAFHWIIEQNTLARNRWGIFLQHADMIDLAANRFAENKLGDVHLEADVLRLVQRQADPAATQPPKAVLQGPEIVVVGSPTKFDAAQSSDPSGRPLHFRWRVGSLLADGKTFGVTLSEPGFQRLALTVDNGALSDLAWRDLFVIEDLAEQGTEGSKSAWTCQGEGCRAVFADDAQAKLVGRSALRARIDPYSGGRVGLRYTSKASVSLEGKTHLVFWLKTRNEDIPGWQEVNPVVTLHGSGDAVFRLIPKRDHLSKPPYNEARDGWTYFAVPLEGDAEWTAAGPRPVSASAIELGFDSWGAPPLVIWVDGLGLK